MLEFQDKFIEEASELIAGLESELLGLETNPNDKLIIDSIFRVMHTLKGTASMFGFNNIEQITHHLESVYDLIRKEKAATNIELINVTFRAIDCIKRILDTRNNLKPADIKEFNKLLAEIKQISGLHEEEFIEEDKPKTKKKQKTRKTAYYIFYKPDENIYYRGVKPYSVFYELNDLGKFKAIPHTEKIPRPEDFDPSVFYLYWDIFFITEKTYEEVQEVFMFFLENEFKIIEIDFSNISQKEFLEQYQKLPTKHLSLSEIQSIYDALEIGITGKTINRPDVFKPEEKNDKESALLNINEKSADLFKKTSTIRVSSEKLDYLITNVSEFVILYSQISTLAENSNNIKLNKAVQDLGKLSKRLRDNALELRLVPINMLVLKLQRLIRDLSQKLNKDIDFITEGVDTELDKTIIDNLEDPLLHIIRNSLDHGIEDEETRIRMNKPKKGVVRLISFYSGTYVFIQIQDDGRGIDLEKVKKKAIEKGMISSDENLSKRDVYDLLFLPGFSTAENISTVSGRGVGMDVVKQRINELRGEIEIDSEINLGTSVTIKLPLTLSIIDTLKVKLGNALYLVPLSTVETCLQVKYSDLLVTNKRQYEYEGVFIPVIFLHDELGMQDNYPENCRLVVIKQYERKYCLLVDSVLGEYQSVVKPLGYLHKKHDYFSGASIMGDGTLALILDTAKILTIKKESQNHL